MSAIETTTISTESPLKKQSLYTKALKKLGHDRIGMMGLAVVFVYFLIALCVWFGWAGQGWEELITDGRVAPNAEHWFGTNLNGQDILQRAIHSTKTAFEVGFIVAILAALIGGLLGCLAGFFNGTWIDELIIWFYSCIECIPFYLLVAAIAFALSDFPFSMHVAMIAGFWTSTARIVRGEVIKIKHLEFVEAAKALGIPKARVIFKHVLPNTYHLLLVQSTIAFIAAIKAEVILSFLGLGLKEGISWGLMLSEASEEVSAGYLENFFAASGFMFILVIAFNVFSDALQDALDPKKVS